MLQQMKSKSPYIKGLLFCGLAGMMISGCTTYQPSSAPSVNRNKITVAETVERLELYTQSSGLNLSARDEDAVSEFVGLYGQSGQGPLYVNIPGGAAGGIGAQQAKSAIVTRLQSMGIPHSALQMGQYNSKPGAPAPVVVSFRRLTTAPIDCHQGSALTWTSTNQPYENFGCAQTANLAAMIDDPRHLLAPANQTQAPALRRVIVLGKYNEGQGTSTPRPADQVISAGGG